MFALAVDRFVTIGRRTAQFCFGLLMRCLFFGSPLRPPRLLPRQLCGSGYVCRPEFSIIRLKNNSIYFNRINPFLTLGESFDFMTPADSVRRLEMQNSRAESVHLLKPYLQWESVERVPTLRLQTTPQETARCAR